ncbi:MAG: hypothetical protein IPH94_20455 [Saprospiraceae bacterium]|nr:hypothetical protein [Saprospiraceae bacterium]
MANQGKFPDGGGAITWIKDNATHETDLYSKINAATLGNTVQSIFFNAGHYFIAVNNAASVEVVDKTFKRVKTFNQLGFTRYFAAWGNKVVVSAWGAGTEKGKLYVINEALEIERTIEVEGPLKRCWSSAPKFGLAFLMVLGLTLWLQDTICQQAPLKN